MSKKENKIFSDLLLSELNQEDNVELIDIIADQDPEEPTEQEISEDLSILPLRNSVLFPGVVIPITVGRSKSIRLVKDAHKGSKLIGVVAQKNFDTEDPETEDLFSVGTLAKIVKMIALPDGNSTIIIQGKNRFKVNKFVSSEPVIKAKVSSLKEDFHSKDDKETKALIQSLKDAASRILQLSPEIPQEAQMALENIHSPSFLTHFLASNLNVEVPDKQKLLEIEDGVERSTLLLEYMMKEVQMLEIKFEIQQKVHTDIDQQQRDYFLRQQMKVLQDELEGKGYQFVGQGEDANDSLAGRSGIQLLVDSGPDLLVGRIG